MEQLETTIVNTAQQLHPAFALLALLSALSALAFRRLTVDDGASVSRSVDEPTTA